MVYLYTSNTDPKGQAAKQFLLEKKVPFTEINLDAQRDEEAAGRLRGLTNDLLLPTLTEAGEGETERVMAVGFEQKAWEQWLQQKTI